MRRVCARGCDSVLHHRRRRARRRLRDPRAARGRSAADRAPRPVPGVAMSRWRDAVRAVRGPLEFAQRGPEAAERVLELAATLRGALERAAELWIPPEAAKRLRAASELLADGASPEALAAVAAKLAPLLDPAFPERCLAQPASRVPGVGPKTAQALAAQGDRDGRGPALLPAARVRGPARDRVDRQARDRPHRVVRRDRDAQQCGPAAQRPPLLPGDRLRRHRGGAAQVVPRDRQLRGAAPARRARAGRGRGAPLPLREGAPPPRRRDALGRDRARASCRGSCRATRRSRGWRRAACAGWSSRRCAAPAISSTAGCPSRTSRS